jgi:hypothetical protein
MHVAPHVPPLAALLAWVPIGLYFFYRYEVRVAVLLTLIAGWAVLPSANFTPTENPFPYWIMGVCLPGGYFVTKATITGLTVMAGVLFFDLRILRRFRPALWDLPMILWCAVPLLSGIANRAVYQGALREGLRGALYQLLAWGVPYLLGRLYFNDDDSLLLAAKAFVIAGLLYVPVCLIEFFTGPQFYSHVYGYEPYRWLGAERYIGFRPIGFLEDGNQLGIWMATSALLAIGLWKHSGVRRVLGLRVGWAAIALFAVTLLCQSTGSIVLLLCLLPFVLFSRGAFQRGLVITLALVVLGFAGLRLANVVSLRWMVEHERSARSVAAFLDKIDRHSLGWRLEQDERHVKTAIARPLLGWGRWNWWQDGEARPWGLWLLAFGMYGGVGLLALETMQFAPVIRAVWTSAWLPAAGDNLPEPDLPDPYLSNPDLIEQMDPDQFDSDLSESDSPRPDLRLVLAAALLMTAIDNLLNSGMILPLVLVIGGMSAWKASTPLKQSGLG